MGKINVSFKHMQVNKTNSTVLILVGLAAFVIVLTGFLANALLTQRSYQSRVIDQKEIARDQMNENIENASKLQSSYQSFISTPVNIIGGSTQGSGNRDGDNARIALDSLPSSYDFPALITSVEKLAEELNLTITAISGQDQEATSKDISSVSPVQMPIGIAISGSYGEVKEFTDVLERSIRPFKTNIFSLSGTDDSLRLEIDIATYFQPEKKFKVDEEIVR